MSGGGLSKLGTALTVIFIISIVTLLAELFYVLWRRRHQTPTAAATQVGTSVLSNSQTSSDFSTFTSKELLYFFCLNGTNNTSRVEPKSTPTSVSSASAGYSSPEADDDQMEIIDLLKLQNNLYGPSKVLFTIKEEEREDLESNKSLTSSAEKRSKNDSKRMTLEECFKMADEFSHEVAVAIGDDRINVGGDDSTEMTPFSTPCESPAYFTPSASPTTGDVYSLHTISCAKIDV